MYDILRIIPILYIQTLVSSDASTFQIENITTSYKGESFPTKYLLPEKYSPRVSDLDYYINRLHLTVTNFHKELIEYNETEVNTALGMFFTKAVLKRSIRDHGDKLTKTQYDELKEMIEKSSYIISHYVYMVRQERYIVKYGKIELKVAAVMRDDSVQVYSMGEFNRGRFKKWILSNTPMHPYVEKMDNITLPREQYVDITENMDSFYVSIRTSDECISHVVYNPIPIDLSELRPCLPDPFCRKPLLSSPSVSYALSHRLLNLLMLRHSRRCYIQTEKEDDDLMDSLCAFMYREAVYLARRGFFARDLFLEHVALCSLFGYEEFFRQRWFRKAASWMDDKGCIFESHNYLFNRSRIQIGNENDMNKQHQLRKRRTLALIEECHSHPMSLLSTVLAQAIRYTLNLLTV